MPGPSPRKGLTVALATDCDMNDIFRLRHEVYARELGQHPENVDGRLTDPLDEFNSYIVAKSNGLIAGFISITPPGNGSYSVDKYFRRDDVPAPFDEGLYELRLLTVARAFGVVWRLRCSCTPPFDGSSRWAVGTSLPLAAWSCWVSM